MVGILSSFFFAAGFGLRNGGRVGAVFGQLFFEFGDLLAQFPRVGGFGGLNRGGHLFLDPAKVNIGYAFWLPSGFARLRRSARIERFAPANLHSLKHFQPGGAIQPGLSDL